MKRFLCGTPNDSCVGAITQLNAGIRSRSKAHATREDAFKCYQKWLLSQGYKKVGGREFAPPEGVDDGYITLLNKKSKFGAIMRQGKAGSKSLSGVNRFVPKHSGKRMGSGLIICP